MEKHASSEAAQNIIVKLGNLTNKAWSKAKIGNILSIEWLSHFDKLYKLFAKLWIKEKHQIISQIMSHNISKSIGKKRLYTYIKWLIDNNKNNILNNDSNNDDHIKLDEEIFEEAIIALVIYQKIKITKTINKNQDSIEEISKNPFGLNCVDDRKHKSNELYKASYPWGWLWLLITWRLAIKKLLPNIWASELDEICTQLYQKLWWVSFHNNYTDWDYCSYWCGHIKHMITYPSEYNCDDWDINYLKHIMDLWIAWNKYMHVQTYWVKTKDWKEEEIVHKKDFAVVTKTTNKRILEIPNQLKVWSKQFQLFDYSEYILDSLTEKVLPELINILSEKWIQIDTWYSTNNIWNLIHEISNKHLWTTLWYIWHNDEWQPTKQIILEFEQNAA